MQYINRLSDYEGRKEAAVTFGKFDGLHTGKRKGLPVSCAHLT